MKRIYYFSGILFLLLSILILSSCFNIMEEKISGIELRAPTKQIYTMSGDYFAHVYLLVDDELFPLGEDTDYVEKKLKKDEDQGRIVVENIPAGKYILWLGIGTKREENDAFNVQYYYESEEFELVAGSTTTITCDLLDCPFNKALNILGETINGVVVNDIDEGPAIYTSGPDNFYTFNDWLNIKPDFNVTERFAGQFTSYSINSVSKGLHYIGTGPPENYLFLSTTKGISKTNGLDTIDNTFSSNLGEINVLKSLAFEDSDDNVSVFFQRDGGLGGVYQEAATPPTDWVNVDFSEMLKDQLVWDFCVTDNLENVYDNCGYFATALGTLRIPQTLLDEYEEGNEVYLMNKAQFFAILDDKDKEIPIVSLGYDPDDTTPLNSTLYMGTFEGLYYAHVGTATPLNGTPELLEQTEGKRIYIVLLNDDYRVYVSQTYLYLQEKSSTDVVSLPFVSGLPGAISAMDWYGNTLVISGTLGLVALDVDTMF